MNVHVHETWMIVLDRTKSVEAASLRVLRARAGLLGQVGGHEVHGVLLVATVNDTETGRRRELGPVGGPTKPLQVVPVCVEHCKNMHITYSEEKRGVTEGTGRWSCRSA